MSDQSDGKSDDINAMIRYCAKTLGIEAFTELSHDGYVVRSVMIAREVYDITPGMQLLSRSALADRVAGDMHDIKRRLYALTLAKINEAFPPKHDHASEVAAAARALLDALKHASSVPGSVLEDMMRLEQLLRGVQS